MSWETFYSDGKDDFKDNIFNFREWSAPEAVSYAEIKERIESFNLLGRTIKNIRAIGLDYEHSENWVEEAAYNALEDKGRSAEALNRASEYENIDDHLQFLRYMEIDEPLLIEFEDGDRFEILATNWPYYRMSMNKIPWLVEFCVNRPNADASIIFSPCIGAKIESIEIDIEMLSEFKDKGKDIVNCIILWLSNGYGLLISTEAYDYCDVELISHNREFAKMDFSELRSALFNG